MLLQKLQASLVQKDTLKTIAHAYHLPEMVIAPPSVRPSLHESDRNAAEMFEAYTAGVFFAAASTTSTHTHTHAELDSLGNAFQLTHSWLVEVFLPLAAAYHDPIDVGEIEEDRLAEGVKARLNEVWSRAKYPGLEYGLFEVHPTPKRGEEGRQWLCRLVARDGRGGEW